MNSTGPRRSGLLIMGALGCAVVLGGCGSSSSSSGGKAEQAKTAAQILADAKSALFNAKAVHVTGTLTDSGQSETLDLQLQGEDTDGSLTIAGQKLQIIKTGGSIYLNAPASFWTKTAGAAGAALGGKWVTVSSAQAGDAAQLTLQGIAASLNSDDSPLNTATTTTTVSGQKAIELTQKDGSQLFLADSSSPVPLKLVNKGTGQGSVTFTDYGKTQSIKAPAGAVSPQQAVKSSPAAT